MKTKIKSPKHKHQLDREVKTHITSVYELCCKKKSTYIWSCKKCPYLKSKTVEYYDGNI